MYVCVQVCMHAHCVCLHADLRTRHALPSVCAHEQQRECVCWYSILQPLDYRHVSADSACGHRRRLRLFSGDARESSRRLQIRILSHALAKMCSLTRTFSLILGKRSRVVSDKYEPEATSPLPSLKSPRVKREGSKTAASNGGSVRSAARDRGPGWWL